MAIELDLEAVTEVSGRTRFDRALAILVGVAAILAALLAAVEVDAGKQEERALQMASRLSVRVFEGTAGSSPRFSFQINSMQQATTLAINATAEKLVLIQDPDTDAVIGARAEADRKAADRLLAIAESMGAAPGPRSGLDPTTLRLVGGTVIDLSTAADEQGRQVDLADRYGERGNRALFGLSLVALGAVLLGLAAVLGRGVPGRAVIVAASVALVAAAAWGVAALLA